MLALYPGQGHHEANVVQTLNLNTYCGSVTDDFSTLPVETVRTNKEYTSQMYTLQVFLSNFINECSLLLLGTDMFLNGFLQDGERRLFTTRNANQLQEVLTCSRYLFLPSSVLTTCLCTRLALLANELAISCCRKTPREQLGYLSSTTKIIYLKFLSLRKVQQPFQALHANSLPQSPPLPHQWQTQ